MTRSLHRTNVDVGHGHVTLDDRRSGDMIARTKTGVPALELPVTGQLSGGKIGRHFLAAVAFLLGLLIVGAAAPGARSGDGDGFRAMMSEAVSRMHEDMHVPFTGDADRDFA